MLAAGWSIKLVGLPILVALRATPSSSTGNVEATREHVETESKQVDLADNFRLVLGSPDHSGQFAVCLGAVIGISGMTPNRRAAAVADLEIRRAFVSKAFHERFGGASPTVRTLDILGTDAATLCVSAPSASTNDAVSVILESLRATSITPQRWSGLVQMWQSHEGLAAAGAENALQRRLQSLVWLGVPEATTSIASTLEQSLTLQGEQVARSAPVRWQRAVLVSAGEYSTSAVEKEIRTNSFVRDFERARGRAQPTPQAPSEPRLQSPRFTRERTDSPDGHVWLFGWPISHLDTAHASSVDVLAQLLERHLNDETPLGKAGVVTCTLQSERRYGSFVVEVRSRSLDLESVEKWVWLGIDRLKNGQFSRAELNEAIVRTKARANPDSADPISRAWTIASRSFLVKEPAHPRDVSNLGPPEISRLARQDLERNRLSELFGEALPPRPKSTATGHHTPSRNDRTKGAQTRSSVQTNRRPGRIYTVQSGESLQVIAYRFHVTVAEIIRENRLSHPDQIRPGTKIFVPQPPSSVKVSH